VNLVMSGKKMAEIVKKFQTTRYAFDRSGYIVRDIAFSQWKAILEERKGLRRLADRKYLAFRFTQWSRFTKCRKLLEMEEYAAEIDKKLHKMVDLYNIVSGHNAVRL
jgi:hypothetical protein